MHDVHELGGKGQSATGLGRMRNGAIGLKE